MNIGFDYEDTYEKNPAMWRVIITALTANEHTVYVVTSRRNNIVESTNIKSVLGNILVNVCYTNRRAKQQFMRDLNIPIDVWISANPAQLDYNTLTMEPIVVTDLSKLLLRSSHEHN